MCVCVCTCDVWSYSVLLNQLNRLTKSYDKLKARRGLSQSKEAELKELRNDITVMPYSSWLNVVSSNSCPHRHSAPSVRTKRSKLLSSLMIWNYPKLRRLPTRTSAQSWRSVDEHTAINARQCSILVCYSNSCQELRLSCKLSWQRTGLK